MSLADWTACQTPGDRVLTGTHVILEPLDWDAHGPGLFAAVAGPENATLWDYMPIGPFDTLAAFRETFSSVCEALNWRTLVFRRPSDKRILGMSSYMRLREPHGSVEIGCVAFGDELKRSIEASEAMFLMARHVFDELNYRRYEWKCNNDNLASKRAAERLGFAFEGIFRNDMVVKGKNRDTAWYAMTDDDWPQIKAAFERWLAAGNFDSDGRQINRLEVFRQ